MSAAMLAPPSGVRFEGDALVCDFDRFGAEEYRLFLRAKGLPESETCFFPETDTYAIRAPARYAPLLGVPVPPVRAAALPLAPFLFDDQEVIVRLALAAKRFACWSQCGGGKTLIGLEFARHIMHQTGGRVLVTTFPEIVGQWIEQAAEFYGDTLPIVRLASREQMRQWMAGELTDWPKLAVTNYEKWNPKRLESQVVSETKHLAGFIADESSRLKTGGGRQKWSIIKSSKGIEYKLSLTATPAPNDFMEFASQAAFLEKLRDEGEVIWTYFTRDPKSHRWTIRPHAREAFFRFLAGWSIYIRDPKRYGWRLQLPDVPAPDVRVIEVASTGEQRSAAAQILAGPDGKAALAVEGDTNAIQRAKLAQVAKGFRYRKGESGAFDRIESLKPGVVADLVRQEVAGGHRIIVWTVFDAESDILAEHLSARGVPFESLTGKTKKSARPQILERFRRGESPCLLTRASLVGFGLNLQFCSAAAFSGWNDSYEAFFQAVHRLVRHGQTERVRVYVPIIRELEQDTWENLGRKQSRDDEATEEMERHFIVAQRGLRQIP